MKIHPNILMLEEVSKGLGRLLEEVVFVGGAVTSIYIDEPAASPVTPSDDVDCVVEIVGRVAYEEFDRKLRKMGFKTPPDESDQRVLCRWDYKGINVDLMPTDEKILGFSNIWYKDGVKFKKMVMLPSKTQISIFTSPYFLASKLEAFKNRGKNDISMSQDFEDIVTVIEGRKDILAELDQAPITLQKYFRTEFDKLLKNKDRVHEAAQGFLRSPGDPNPTALKFMNLLRQYRKD